MENLELIAYNDAVRPAYVVTDDEIKEITTFTNQSNTHKYSQRNKQASSSKLMRDIQMGKMGEVAASKYLKENFDLDFKADFKIYAIKDKSFDADLGSKIHVKSCNMKWRSWTFQYANGTDPLLLDKDSEEWLVLTEVDVPKKTVYIRALVQWKDVSNLIDLPKLEYLHDTKRCLYWDDQSRRKIKKIAEKNDWLES